MRSFVATLALIAAVLSTHSVRAQASLDPETVREAQALMARFDVVALVRQQLAASQQQMAAILKSANLGAETDELLTKYVGELQEKFQQRMPQYIEESTLIYARHFTRDELKQLNAFYESSLGRKLIEKTPEILRQCSELSAQILGPLVQEMFARMKADLSRAKQSPK